MIGESRAAETDGVIQKMFEAGAHFGYSRSRNHPSTRRFVFGFKNRGAVIDLLKTRTMLEAAKDFLRRLGEGGKLIMLVGNKDEARQIVKEAAEALNLPYVAFRWLGGTFTNFGQIKTRVDRLIQWRTEAGRGAGDSPASSSKKDLTRRQKEIARLEQYFSNLVHLDKLPAALVVIDSDYEKIAVAEAGKTGVPIVSLSGTDCDLRGIDYPIVANDANVSSIRFFINELMTAYRAGRPAAVAASQPVKEPATLFIPSAS